ncbi:MAG: molybdopterin-guanine dinucleotide biosynthesis protein [Bacillales bacterium]|jgi:molybdopterin-guanine dinucleotide biosynthesis protein A|nr:molybdopterin-guanine dinucleotide biosynthesis protein [Bacillales bacterium]
MDKLNISNIILAGGLSSRMGTNKAELKIGEHTVIERIIKEFEPPTNESIIVTNNPNCYNSFNWKCVSDIYFQKGPLGGIHAGLLSSTNEINFVISCDMPFPNAKLLTKMLEHIHYNDIVVPVINEKLHPLFGLYKKSILTELIDCLEQDNLRVRKLYEKLSTYYITEKELYTKSELEKGIYEIDFFNMNTMNDYSKAKSLYSEF